MTIPAVFSAYAIRRPAIVGACCQVFSLLCLLGALIPAVAEPLLPYSSVDRVWAQNHERFRALFDTARSNTLRIALFGDSQETSPGGAGRIFVPRLNFEFWQRFGNVPESQLVGYGSFGGAEPGAEWILRGGTGSPGPAPGRVPTTFLLPGLNGISQRAHSTKNFAVNANGQAYGQLIQLLHNGIGLDSALSLPAPQVYFDTSGVVKARIFAATHPMSGEAAYRALPTDSPAPSFFSAATTTGQLNMDLANDAFDVRWSDTAPLRFDGQSYMALEIFGSDDNRLTDLIGARFFNESNPSGVVVQDIAAGGYTIGDFLRDYANAGPLFRALDFQAAVLHYGANDSGRGVTAGQFRADTASLIERLRNWAGDANFPVILIADVDRELSDDTKRFEFDRYVGAQLSIAEADPNVMVINLRRLAEERGWAVRDPRVNSLLLDGVHYTTEGAIVAAQLEAAAMLGEIRPETWTVQIDPPGGTYNRGTLLALTVDKQSAEIRFTVDGSEPTGNSQRYVAPLLLDAPALLKAQAFLRGYAPSSVVTAEFQIEPPAEIPPPLNSELTNSPAARGGGSLPWPELIFLLGVLTSATLVRLTKAYPRRADEAPSP